MYIYTYIYINTIYINTSASVKSYQLVKVVSGGRAPGKSSILASPQLLVIERFLRFGAVRLEKVHFFFIALIFFKYI